MTLKCEVFQIIPTQNIIPKNLICLELNFVNLYYAESNHISSVPLTSSRTSSIMKFSQTCSYCITAKPLPLHTEHLYL